MLKKLKITEIIITLILLMGQLIPSTALAEVDSVNNRTTAISKVINSSAAVSKVVESNLNISNIMSSSEHLKSTSQQPQENTESSLQKVNSQKIISKDSNIVNYFKWKADWQKNQSFNFSAKTSTGTEGGPDASDKFPFNIHTENEIEVSGLGDTVPQLMVGESSYYLRTSKDQPLRPKFTALPDTMKWIFQPVLAPWIDIPNNENGVFDSKNIRGGIEFDDWPRQGEHASGFAFAPLPDKKNVLYNFTSKNPSKVNIATDGYVNYDDDVPPPPNGAPRYVYSIDNRVYYPQIIQVQYRDIDNPDNLLSDGTVGNGEVYGSQVNVGYNVLPGFNFVNSQIVDGPQQRYTSANVNTTVNTFSYTGETIPEEVTDNKNIDLKLDNQQKGIIFWVKKQIPETSTHVYNRHDEEITDTGNGSIGDDATPDKRYIHNYQHLRYRFSIKNTSDNAISNVDFNSHIPENGKYVRHTGYAWVGDDNSPKYKPKNPGSFDFGDADTGSNTTIAGTYKGKIEAGQTLTIEYEYEVHPVSGSDLDVTNGGKGIGTDKYGETVFTLAGGKYNPPAITRTKKSFFSAMTKDIRNETQTPKGQDGWVNGDGYNRITIFGQPGDIINYRLKVGVTSRSSEDIDLNQKDADNSKTIANAITDSLDTDLELIDNDPTNHPIQATYPGSSDGTEPDDATGFDKDGYHLTDSLNPMKDYKEHNVILTFSARVKDSPKDIIPNQAHFLGRNPLTDSSDKASNHNEKTSNEADVKSGGPGLNKQVKNETAGDTDYKEKTNANSGDTVDYQLTFTPPRGGSYKPAKIVDNLDSRLDYVPGSLKIGNTALDDSNFENSTLSIDLSQGGEPVNKAVTVTFKAKVNSTAESNTLISNYGIFTGTESVDGTTTGKVEEVSNDAQVKILSLEPTVEKYVSDLTTDSDHTPNDPKKDTKIDAYPGDKLWYRIKVGANVQKLENIQISDLLPDEIDIPDGNKVSLDIKVVDSAGGLIGGTKVHTVDIPISKTTDGKRKFELDVNKTIGTKLVVVPGNYLIIDMNGEKVSDVKNDILADKHEADVIGDPGVTFDNVATVTNSSYGDNNGDGWNSNAATVHVIPVKTTMTKQVKKVSETEYEDHDITKPLEINSGEMLNYRVDINSDSNIKNGDLSDIKLKDNFGGLNRITTDPANPMDAPLLLTGVKINYYGWATDGSGEIVLEPDKTETYGPAEVAEIKDSTIPLQHNVSVGGYVEVIYNVTVTDKATDGYQIDNTATITSDSYGLNNDDLKRDGWYSNNASIKISAKGKVIIRYVDRSTKDPDKADLIHSAPRTNGSGQIEIEGKIGKTISDVVKNTPAYHDALGDDWLTPENIDGYTAIDQTNTASEDTSGAFFSKAKKEDPAISKDTQYLTYRYEKAAISLEVPKNWDFGRFDATAKDFTYLLPAKKVQGKEKPYQVKVDDYYGVDNWKLSLSQEHQFATYDLPRHKLTGAQLQADYLSATRVADEGNSEDDTRDEDELKALPSFVLPDPDKGDSKVDELMTYTKKGHYTSTKNHPDNLDKDAINTEYNNPGWNVSKLQFGNDQQASYSIGLHVPATTKRYKTRYQTVLTWELSVAP